MVKGPLTVTDMVCWHAGMGMGLYGVKPLRLAHQNRKRIPRFFHRDEYNAPDVMQRVHWDPGVRAPVRQPDHVRLRPHARDVAHPPLHRLDGRRRLAVEARVRVPEVQLRRRHAMAARSRGAEVPRRTATAPRSISTLTAENQRGEVTTPGTATILLPSREHGPVRLPDPPGGARDLAGRARRDLGRVLAAMTDFAGTGTDGLVVALDDDVLHLTLDRPDKRNAISESMMRGVDRSGERRRRPTSACA